MYIYISQLKKKKNTISTGLSPFIPGFLHGFYLMPPCHKSTAAGVTKLHMLAPQTDRRPATWITMTGRTLKPMVNDLEIPRYICLFICMCIYIYNVLYVYMNIIYYRYVGLRATYVVFLCIFRFRLLFSFLRNNGYVRLFRFVSK